MVRAVIDPGVLVAATIAPEGTPSSLLLLAAKRKLALIASPKLLAEFHGVLSRDKFRRYLPLDDVVQVVEDIAALAEVVNDPESRPGLSRDPKDDYLIVLAEAANAVLVTGDKDLADVTAVQILSPAGLLKELGAEVTDEARADRWNRRPG